MSNCFVGSLNKSATFTSSLNRSGFLQTSTRFNKSNKLVREGLGYSFFSFPENPRLYQDYNIPYNPTGTSLNFNNEIYKIGRGPDDVNYNGINYRKIVEESLKTKNKPLGWTYSDVSIPVYKKPTQPIKIKPKETERMLEATLPEVVVKPPVDYSNSGLYYSIGVDKGKIVYRAGSIGNMKTMTPQQFEEFKKTDEFKKYNEVRKNDTPSLEQQLTVPQAGYIKMMYGGTIKKKKY